MATIYKLQYGVRIFNINSQKSINKWLQEQNRVLNDFEVDKIVRLNDIYVMFYYSYLGHEEEEC